MWKQATSLLACVWASTTLPAAAQTVGAAGACPVFPSNNIWNARVDTLPVHARSADWVQAIGQSRSMHQDFGGTPYAGVEPGMQINLVTGAQPPARMHFTDGAAESDPGPYPFPPDARVEGGSDRHVIVVDVTNCILYETFYSYKNADNSWTVSSGAVFNLRSNLLRPNGWTSADAAGLPILAGLARYEEIAAGEIRHALRFTVPRSQTEFVWPGRHQAGATGELTAPPMGARFRLKASFDISGFSETTRIILTALKRYGMMVSDNGGAWYLQGTYDPRWPNLADEWRRIPGSAFEAVDVSGLMQDGNSAAVAGATAAPILTDAAFTTSAVTAGQGATLRVTLLEAAPSGGATVALSATNGTVASPIVVPAGQTSATAAVTAALPGPASVQASLNGIARTASITVNPAPANQPVALQSITPSSGAGDTAAFVIRTSDADGASDIARVDLYTGASLDAAGCHIALLLGTTPTVYLRQDSGNWSPAAPGAASSLTNGRCTLDASQLSHLLSGNTATTAVPLRFASTFRGDLRLFVRAWDRAGSDTTWRVLGSWSLTTAAAPAIASLSPNRTGGEAGAIAARVTDANGGSDVARIDFLVGETLDTPHCHVSYNLSRGLVYLRNPDGVWQAAVPGSQSTLTNSRCSLDVSRVAAVVSGNTITGTVSLRLNTAALSPNSVVYLRAFDASGLDTSWRASGVWLLGSALTAPSFRSVTPTSGSGVAPVFVIDVADTVGVSNLTYVALFVGPTLDTAGCQAIYNISLNTLYLRNPDGTWQAGQPGAATTLSTARCAIALGAATRVYDDQNLTLTIPVQLTSAMAGVNRVYVRAANRLGFDTEWGWAGTWTR